MKKVFRETQTLHASCSKVEPTIFAPPQIPIPGAQDGQNNKQTFQNAQLADKGACGNYTGTMWNKAVFSNCLKSLRDKSRLRRWAGMSFQAVGPEEPKERSPQLAVQDRGTSSVEIKQYNLVAANGRWLPCGWEGKYRSGIALGTHHRHLCFSIYRLNVWKREMSTPYALL